MKGSWQLQRQRRVREEVAVGMLLADRTRDDPQSDLIQQRIAEIGLRISPEWAKEEPNRYIHTHNVSTWGESLLEALSRDQLLPYMDQVMLDIDLLEAGELSHKAISMDRYFPTEFDDQDDEVSF